MSTPSFKIEAHGTSSSLVPGTIQNARNNNLEIITIVQTIPANETGSNHDEPLGIVTDDLNNKEIVGSTAEIVATEAIGQDVSIGTNAAINDLLAPVDTYPSGSTTVPLLANLSTPVQTDETGSVITVRSAAAAKGFTLTLRLILRKL